MASIAPDTAAASIAGTHTTPPYPGIARKMGEQGTVKLRLTISPQGVVTAADVVQSSGFPDLDQTAVSWVMSHWKYKPAVQAGVAVTSTDPGRGRFQPEKRRLTRSLCAPCKSPWGDGIEAVPLRARSSAGEHYLDMVGVTGSIPVAPTIISFASRTK